MNGTVYLIGAGPGDAGLLTVKGRWALERADVVVYDALVGEAILALAPSTAECINVGKRSRNHTMPQEAISQLLLDKALGAGAKRFRLLAQRQAEGFYSHYGFTPYGEEVLDQGVPHIEMEATDVSILRAVFSGCRGEEMLRREQEGKKEE